MQCRITRVAHWGVSIVVWDTVQPGKQDWFWREIVQINLNRGLRYAIILIIIDMVLVGGDVIRVLRGVIPGHRGYTWLFIAHLLLLGILAIFLLVYYFTRPASADAITRGHGALAVGFATIYLAFCTSVALIDQVIDGQITVYVIGCMTLAVAVHVPLRVSLPLLSVNHAIFVVGVTLLQSDGATLTNHYVNGSIVAILAAIITKVLFDAQRRVFQGMSIIQSQQSKLERLAIEDSLTGLNNRRYADSRLTEEFERSRRYDRPFSIGMADIDHFKEVNDNHSHQVGDEVLRQLAGLLRAEIRAVDVVARYGGEEFIIIFPETSEETASVVCEKIRSAIERHNWSEIESEVEVTISIGVSGSTKSHDLAGMIRLADDRLYQAKRSGRNRVAYGR
jgi:diguanylate cyclase (GGDEF)-like protein